MLLQGLWQRWVETVQQLGWEERLVIGLVGLASLIAIAVYAIRRVRAGIRRPTASLHEHLGDFRRMREKGQLDDQEFTRVVNTVSRQEQGAGGQDRIAPALPKENLTPPEPPS